MQVWPEHWHAWCVFRDVETQWRCSVLPDGRLWWHGLDYSALGLVMAAHRANPHRQPLPVLMQQLHQLEVVAANARNEELMK